MGRCRERCRERGKRKSEARASGNVLRAAISFTAIWYLVVPVVAASSACRTSCGGVSIQYPFGIDQGCGSYGLSNSLGCSNSTNTLSFITPSLNYTVQSIDYSRNTISLSDQSMTTCSDGLVPGKNFSLDSSSPFYLFEDSDLLLLNCNQNASLVRSSLFSCDDSASACSAFKTCTDYANTNTSKLVTTCCALNTRSNKSIDLSVLSCAGYTSLHNYNSTNTDISNFKFFIELSWNKPQELSQCNLCRDSSGSCGYNFTLGFSCLCEDTNTTSVCPESSKRLTSRTKAVIGGTSAGVGTVILCIIVVLTRCCRREKTKEFEVFEFDAGDGMDGISEAPTRFSYKDLIIATDNFSNQLGQGGFGAVYKGMLTNGQLIAVKKLEGSRQGEKQFRAEVSTIGNIHHFNLVRFFGYCFEGSERLLVYEYMNNSSLDKFVFKGGGFVLDWPKRYSIALDVAHALAYLHEGCRKRIVHCDVKPENILLDENFSGKLSDFGLAKLIDRQDADTFTVVRGTRGYLAPEWFLSNTPITEKCDVYSYGMVLLELIGGRRNVNFQISSPQFYFHIWVYHKIENADLTEIIDRHLENTADSDQVMRLARLALWCVQEDPSQRPTMGKVVQVLEGVAEIQNPPVPFRRPEGDFYIQTNVSATTMGSWSYPSAR